MRFAKVPDWLLPSPIVICKAIWTNRAVLPGHFGATLFASLSGFAVAVAVGVPLAVVITSSKVARNILYPLFLIFESVPKVALAPLILLWVGYGMPSKVLVAAVTAFFPIVINTGAGLSSVSEEMFATDSFLRRASAQDLHQGQATVCHALYLWRHEAFHDLGRHRCGGG